MTFSNAFTSDLHSHLPLAVRELENTNPIYTTTKNNYTSRIISPKTIYIPTYSYSTEIDIMHQLF